MLPSWFDGNPVGIFPQVSANSRGFSAGSPTPAGFTVATGRPSAAVIAVLPAPPICLAHAASPCSLLHTTRNAGRQTFLGFSPPSPNLSVRWWRQVPPTVTAENCFSLNGFCAKWALFCLACTRLSQPGTMLGTASGLRSPEDRGSRTTWLRRDSTGATKQRRMPPIHLSHNKACLLHSNNPPSFYPPVFLTPLARGRSLACARESLELTNVSFALSGQGGALPVQFAFAIGFVGLRCQDPWLTPALPLVWSEMACQLVLGAGLPQPPQQCG